jgi:hypothetical protein
MSVALLDALIASQNDLLAALDQRDVGAIEEATVNLAIAVSAAKAADVWRDQFDSKSKIDYALKQTEAARARVNFLADWNRQKIEKLAVLRGNSVTATYKKSPISSHSRLA